MMAQHNNYISPDDPDLAGLEFTEIQKYNQFVRCTRKQREHLESIMRKRKITYKQLVKECSLICGGKDFRGIGELEKGEARECIRKMEEWRIEHL